MCGRGGQGALCRTQTNARNTLTLEERFRPDAWCINNWSPSLYLKILLMTVVRTAKRDGIGRDGYATMPEFRRADRVQYACVFC